MICMSKILLNQILHTLIYMRTVVNVSLNENEQIIREITPNSNELDHQKELIYKLF